MNEIKCPNCGKMFQISESDYESIIKQIRDSEFDKELKNINEQHEKDKQNSVELAKLHLKEELNSELSKKEKEISDLKNELKMIDTNNKLEIEKKLNEKEKTIDNLNSEINDLKNELKVIDTNNKLEVQNKLNEKEKTIDSLNNEIELKKREFELEKKKLEETYESKIKDKDEQIAYYKDFKAKQSTKMIGESLEQHCYNEFNKLRPLFANATLDKDNDASSGSKGDFIFRDYDDDHNEIVSIMFEMKNEADETSTKHKNEHFFKELDKDRNEKKCEYAVLVSMLEMDNEYYNDGIVDVSHVYDKMYVIRPQFFIPLITLIRNLAKKSVDYRKELELVKNQNIDITNFESKMNSFKEGFSRDYRIASDKFKTAIEEIDKSIDHLQKIKKALESSEDHLRLANNKAEDLTIKKLTYNNPTMTKMFKELESTKEE